MEQLVNFIIRPPRAKYNPKSDLINEKFMLKDKLYQRKDVEVKNSRGDILQCSHYIPVVSPEGKPLPCVIYCHGNSGCRVDATETAIILLPSNITVFTVDFSGSGLSGGEHVSLGWYEKDDLKAVVEYLRTDGNVSLIGLWGRSMGAVTSLMYGAEDPSIAGMVLDSPFSDLVDLMMELADTQAFRLPKFTVKLAIQYMRRAIQKKAKFDIMDLNAIKFAKTCFVPVLFGHAKEDDFIRPHHSDRIFEAYMGDKNIIKFEGDHNSPRPQFYFDSINIFFHNVLQPPEDEVAGPFCNSTHDYFGKVDLDWDNLREVGYAHETSGGPSSTGNVSTQPCSRQSPDHAENAENSEAACASSSGIINFELLNGHPYGPHVPTTADDEQYVEYMLNDLSGFPCTPEEEEKMLMEAVLLSLRDLEIKHPDGNKPDHDNNCESHASNDNQDDCPNPEHDRALKSKSTSPSEENLPSVSESERQKTPAASINAAIPSDVDTSDSTSATVTVERNKTSQIMDGLIRRWDFSFFKNGR